MTTTLRADSAHCGADSGREIVRKIKTKEETMTGNEYQEKAMRTCTAPDLNHAVFGLCSEAGEVAGIMQKRLQGHGFDAAHMKKELGDCLWMIAEACAALGLSMEDVMQCNIDKLLARYPDGFDPARSRQRAAGDV